MVARLQASIPANFFPLLSAILTGLLFNGGFFNFPSCHGRRAPPASGWKRAGCGPLQGRRAVLVHIYRTALPIRLHLGAWPTATSGCAQAVLPAQASRLESAIDDCVICLTSRRHACDQTPASQKTAGVLAGLSTRPSKTQIGWLVRNRGESGRGRGRESEAEAAALLPSRCRSHCAVRACVRTRVLCVIRGNVERIFINKIVRAGPDCSGTSCTKASLLENLLSGCRSHAQRRSVVWSGCTLGTCCGMGSGGIRRRGLHSDL